LFVFAVLFFRCGKQTNKPKASVEIIIIIMMMMSEMKSKVWYIMNTTDGFIDSLCWGGLPPYHTRLVVSSVSGIIQPYVVLQVLEFPF